MPDVSQSFDVKLMAPSNVDIAGPAVAAVTVFDDEGSQKYGHWGSPMCWGIIGMNAHLMPTTGTVLYWDRLGNVASWDPSTEVSTPVDGPGYDLFCAGEAFLPDGRLLMAGGDDSPMGAPPLDGIGVPNLSAYDPLQPLPWQSLPTMNASRWYPTVTILSDGTALILSGSLDLTFDKNTLPEVYDPKANALRDLTAAVDNVVVAPHPLGGALYPWMFALPNAKAVKVGPDVDTWTLDTAALGAWTRGPDRIDPTGAVRDYGSASLVGRQAYIFGGGGAQPVGPAPVNAVDSLDVSTLTWTAQPPMFIGRRQLTSTVLPDGRILVTGGTYGPGFSDLDTAATPAEIFDGTAWTLLPADRATRLSLERAASGRRARHRVGRRRRSRSDEHPEHGRSVLSGLLVQSPADHIGRAHDHHLRRDFSSAEFRTGRKSDFDSLSVRNPRLQSEPTILGAFVRVRDCGGDTREHRGRLRRVGSARSLPPLRARRKQRPICRRDGANRQLIRSKNGSLRPSKSCEALSRPANSPRDPRQPCRALAPCGSFIPFAAPALLPHVSKSRSCMAARARPFGPRPGAAPARDEPRKKPWRRSENVWILRAAAWFAIPVFLVCACGGRDLAAVRGPSTTWGANPPGGTAVQPTAPQAAASMLGSGASAAGAASSGPPGVSSPTVTEPPSDAAVPVPSSSLRWPRGSWTTCSI